MFDLFFIHNIGPYAGALDAESPKSKHINKQRKHILITKHLISSRICIIFCMREAVYISLGPRILPSPLRPLKRPKHFNLLFASSYFYFLGLFSRAHLGYGYTSCAGANSSAPALPCGAIVTIRFTILFERPV